MNANSKPVWSVKFGGRTLWQIAAQNILAEKLLVDWLLCIANIGIFTSCFARILIHGDLQ